MPSFRLPAIAHWCPAFRPGRSVAAEDMSVAITAMGHAENHDWYEELKQPGTGYSCCNGTINGSSKAIAVRRGPTSGRRQWRALIDGHWVLIPPASC